MGKFLRPFANGQRRSVTLLFTVSAVLLLAVACGGEETVEPTFLDIDRGPDTPVVIPSDEPIVVGISTALTGSVGPRGLEYRDAVILGVERWKAANGETIAGREIVVHSEDDGCTAPGAASHAAERLLRRPGLVGVIGPQCSAGAEAAIPIYNAAGVVAISGSATRTDLTVNQTPNQGFFFRTAFRNDLEGTLIGNFIAENPTDAPVILIDDGSLYAVDLMDTSQDVAEASDVSIVRMSAPRGTVDFGPIVSEVIANEAFFVGYGGFNPDAGLLLRQLKDAGWSGEFGAGDAAASQANFVDPLGPISEGVLFAGCQVDLPQSYGDEYTDMFGLERIGATFAGHYTDAVVVLLDAVKRVATEDGGNVVIDPIALRDSLRNESFMQDALTGSIAFDGQGDRVPAPGDELAEVIERGFTEQDSAVLRALGFVQCQVQDGILVDVSAGGRRSGEQ